MKNTILIVNIIWLCLNSMPVYAEKMRIGLLEEVDSTVDISSSLKKNLSDAIKERLSNSGKFEIIERDQKDLKALFEEQKFSDEEAGRVDINDEKRAKFGKMLGVEYVIRTTLNEFSSSVESSKFKKVTSPNRHFVKLGMDLKIVDSTTAKIKAMKSIVTKEYYQSNSYYSQGGTQSPELIAKVVASLSNKIVNKILDELYPIKVLDRTGNSVGINRGKDHGIKINDILAVFAIKKVLDEDTQEEVDMESSVGKIKITSVSDMTAQAEILKDFGITKGCITRLIEMEDKVTENMIKENMDKKIDAEDW